MTTRTISIGKTLGHPASGRGRARLTVLGIGLVGAPAVWAVQLLANYSFATGACYPKDVPLPSPHSPAVWWVMLAISLAAPVLGAIVLAIAAMSFRRTHRRREESEADVVEQGEGRTRFLSACGLMTSAGFVVLILMTSAVFLYLPLC